MVLVNFYVKDNPVFNNDPKLLPKSSPYCPILFNWIFDNFILADKPFAKDLRSFKVCILANKNLCRKLFS